MIIKDLEENKIKDALSKEKIDAINIKIKETRDKQFSNKSLAQMCLQYVYFK